MGSVVAADEGVVVEVEADEVIGSDFSADSNGTRRFALTDEEREGLAKLFDSVDVDGSGGVDYLELASFLRAMSELDDDLKAAKATVDGAQVTVHVETFNVGETQLSVAAKKMGLYNGGVAEDVLQRLRRDMQD